MFLLHWGFSAIPFALSVLAFRMWPSPWTGALAFLVAGVFQNGLGVLMHEGCHYFFHPNKRTNDRLADLLVCLPIFNTVAGYRSSHFDHHRFSGSPSDPYRGLYADYRGRVHVLLCLLSDLLLVGSMAKFVERYLRPPASGQARPRSLGTLVGLAVVQSSILGALTLTTGLLYGYFVFWLLPLLTIPAAINRVRAIVEHHAMPGDPTVNRSTDAGPLDYLLVAPYGYSYHFEHHLVPSIPYYDLARAHHALRESGFAFTPQELSRGYLRTFLSIMRAGIRESAP